MFDLKDRPADAPLVQRMTSALAHRGPDAHGLHMSGRVGLGHTRLSIIDLGGGAQPMGTPDGNLQLSFSMAKSTISSNCAKSSSAKVAFSPPRPIRK